MIFYLILQIKAITESICPNGMISEYRIGRCICPEGQGILENGKCGICPLLQGINPATKKCTPCTENECIGLNGIITLLKQDVSKDPSNNLCFCKAPRGLDANGNCNTCPEDTCSDPISRQCIPIAHAKDPSTGECTACKAGEGVDPKTHSCKICPSYEDCNCPDGYGIDPDQNRCVKCKEGEGILLDVYQCGKCPPGYGIDSKGFCSICDAYTGIDQVTKKCRSLNSNEGIDSDTNEIITCPEGATQSREYICICPSQQGLLSNNQCGTCPEGEGIDKTTGKCGPCKENYGLDENSIYCIDCKGNHVDSTSKKCVQCNSVEGYCYDQLHDECINIPANAIASEDYAHSCMCKSSKEFFDPETMQCIECPSEKAVIGNYCQKCPPYKCFKKDENDNLVCSRATYDLGIDEITQECTTCNVGEGLFDVEYDSSTIYNVCGICKTDECIGIRRTCQKIGINVTVDPITNECKCLEHQGFGENRIDCKFCQEGYGINSYGQCVSCWSTSLISNDLCIDQETYKCRQKETDELVYKYHCISCPEDASYNNFYKTCKCNDPAKGFDPETGKCVQCKINEIVNQTSLQCQKCPPGQAILSGQCIECQPNEGINGQTWECSTCPDGEGILPYTKVCGTCPENSQFNPSTLKCECLPDFIEVDPGQCQKCPEGQEVSDDKKSCVECDVLSCFDTITHKCMKIDKSTNIGLKYSSSICTTCPPGANNNLFVCMCDANKGYNSDYSECVDCAPFEGLDGDAHCVKCPFGYCINDRLFYACSLFHDDYQYTDSTNGFCLTTCNGDYEYYSHICDCPDNSISENGYCKCKAGEGILYPEFVCGKCPDEKGINQTTGRCSEVEIGYCIDSDGFIVEATSLGVNPTNYKCVTECEDGKGINLETRLCDICTDEDKCIDTFNNECRPFKKGEAKNMTTSKCICQNKKVMKGSEGCEECPVGFCINSQNKCESTGILQIVDPDNGKCIKLCSSNIDPLTNICGVCPEGSITNEYKCRCPFGQGVLPDKYECGDCPADQGVDLETQRCRVCNDLYGIDQTTKECVKCDTSKGYGIDSSSRICRQCKADEGIDLTTHECRHLKEYEGISADNFCISCTYPKTRNPETNKCSCPKGFGFNDDYECVHCHYGIDPITLQCQDCYDNKEGINPDTKFCQKCGLDEGIDPFTRECVKCPKGTSVSFDSPFCVCPYQQGYDDEKKECVTCENWKGIDPKSNRCIYCPIGQGIDPETLVCRECPKGYGIDRNNGKCTLCPEKQGMEPITHFCKECAEGEAIVLVTGECGVCGLNQHIDEKTNRCRCDNFMGIGQLHGAKECSSCYERNYCVDDETDKCIFVPYGLGIKSSNGHCGKCENENEGVTEPESKCGQCPANKGIRYNGFCGDCDNIQTIDSATKKCKCPETKCLDINTLRCADIKPFIGINPNNNLCQKCDNQNGEGIDPQTRICVKCQSINPANGECTTCPTGSVLNSNTHICECKTGEGINTNTNSCGVCDTDSIDFISGECTTCTNGQVKDESTKKCICPANQGFNNLIEKKCITCPFAQGIDQRTLECRDCGENECIDETNGKCRQILNGEAFDAYTMKCLACPDGTFFDHETSTCKCQYGFGFDSEKQLCIQCQDGEGIDLITNRCGKCEDQYGIYILNGSCGICRENVYVDKCIDRFSFHCRNMLINETYHESSHLCQCIIGYGYNRETNSCEKCKDGQGVDPITNECKTPKENECIHWNSHEIHEIYENQIKDEMNKCTCPPRHGFNDYRDDRCYRCGNHEGVSYSSRYCQKIFLSSNTECVDQETGFVRYRKENEIINPTNYECFVCPKGSKIDPETGMCQCDPGYGINKDNECAICEPGEGIDQDTYKCGKCAFSDGINPITKVCIHCSFTNECIDVASGECIELKAGQQKNDYNELCHCKIGQGYLENTSICSVCPDNYQAINWYTGACTNCSENQVKDAKTGKCVCQNINQGFDSEYKKCVDCPFGYGVDYQTRQCRKMMTDRDECIDYIDGIWSSMSEHTLRNETTNYCYCESDYHRDLRGKCRKCYDYEYFDPNRNLCMLCSSGQVIDEETYKCVCSEPKQGLDPETDQCITCKSKYGVDPVSNFCVLCSGDKCIDRATGKCVDLQEDQTKDEYNNLCNCPKGLGFNSITQKCESCPEGQGISLYDNKCQICHGEGINPITKVCQICDFGQGIDPKTRFCGTCPKGTGISRIDYECIECYNNEGIDQDGYCGKCKAYTGLDSTDKMCKDCSDKNCLICSDNYQTCTFCDSGYIVQNGNCVQDQVAIETPVPTPDPVTLPVYSSNYGELKIRAPENPTDNKNYYVKIDSEKKSKTLVVEDVGQSQIGIIIDEDVDYFTIKQKANKPINIIVNYKYNINEQSTVFTRITIDSSKESTAETSIQGKGSFEFENSYEGDDIEIEAVVPKFGEELRIHSKSNLKVKKIDIYGNSKVEFYGFFNNRMTVNEMNVQQKAVTELNYIKINGDLNAGVLSMITLTCNAELQDTNIRISRSEKAASSNPLFVGEISSCPKSISFKSSSAKQLLDEEETVEFVIAESDKDKFNCAQWIEAFDKESDPILKNAECVDSGNNKVKLIVNNKKIGDDGEKPKNNSGGISKGAIIAIAVVAVVVVVVVVILVVYFVIRKKRSHSQNEDESFESDGQFP